MKYCCYSGQWSTLGCITSTENATATTCECSHMTNFAILVSQYHPVRYLRTFIYLYLFVLITCYITLVSYLTADDGLITSFMQSILRITNIEPKHANKKDVQSRCKIYSLLLAVKKEE